MKKLFFDCKEPWGLSPLAFGSVWMIWVIFSMIFGFGAMLSGSMSITSFLLLLLVPVFILLIYEAIRMFKFGNVIIALAHVASSASMITEAVPVYMTIFLYNKRSSAPAFQVDWHDDKDKFTIQVVPNGCKNAEVPLLHLLQHEFLNYDVRQVSELPEIFEVKKRTSNKRVSREDFRRYR